MFEKILFVTDNCDIKKEYNLKSRDSEGNKPAAKEEMIRALQKLADEVYTTYSLKEANELIISNPDLYVVTTYYGEAEQDSKSLVPAICKANNVTYLGADSYTQMICNDKNLSKKYMDMFELNFIPGILIYSPKSEEDISRLHSLSYPLIVKPNFGGGSNGIMNCSVTNNWKETTHLIKQIYKYQKMPVIVEQYIPGYEVSFIIIGNKNHIDFYGESMLSIDGKSMFENEVFGLESKKISPNRKKYQPSNFIDTSTREKMFKLFQSFDKCEFMRIDCRIDINGKINIIELSPDCYIGSNGAFYETVKQSNISFDDMIAKLISNSIKYQADRI